jgi:hypothetical protein
MISKLLVVATVLASVLAHGATFDKEVPTDIKNQMIADMQFMGSIQGPTVSPFHQKIYGQMNGQDYLKFFNTRVEAIGLNSCGSANAVACVIPFFNPNKMWITQNYIKFSHPQVARSMVVFHDARHTESQNGNWSHATCPTPFNDPQGKPIMSIWTGANLAGEPACDITPFGSYGSSMIMLKNISKFCATCTAKVKMDAGIYADDQFKRIIDPKAVAAIKQDVYAGRFGRFN